MSALDYAYAETGGAAPSAWLTDPEGVELMLLFHVLREGEHRGRCVQCARPWPCAYWQEATLARMLQAAAPPRRRRKSISWLVRRRPISWFSRPDSLGSS
ncbi:MAG: hypothetical protein ACRDRH_03565 [Pseudonocardia sp.]